MKKKISKLIPFRIKFVISVMMYTFFRIRIIFMKRVPKVLNFDETVNNIIDSRMSVSRFGDGEFKWMFQRREDGNFEMNSPELAYQLKRVMKNENPKLMHCVPDVFSGLSSYNNAAQEYWGVCLGLYGVTWAKSLMANVNYFDTQFTRPYMDYKDKSNVPEKFLHLKKIWNHKDVLLVEGSKSRFGLGNDLLENANSIRRILAPATNAFEKYEKIKEKLLECATGDSNEIILISLGPTATVLAADCADLGWQAIDIGHLDIEYSWYLMNAKDKVPIAGKYVNEVPDGGREVRKISDQQVNSQYEGQIICRVG